MKQWMIRLFGATMLTTLLAVSAFAAGPNVVPYQGRLTDAAGNPINTTQTVTFLLYDAATSGTLLYSETQSVTPVGGNFSVLLGTGTAVTGTWSADLFAGAPVYLAIKVGADPEMTPRVQLGAVPYALRSFTGPGLSHTIGSGPINVTTSNTNIVSTTITTPAAGYIYVTATGQLDIYGTTGASGYVVFYITETSAGSISGGEYTIHGPSSLSGLTYNAVGFHRVLFKPAGTYTFYLVAYKGSASATGEFWYPRISAMYFPEAMGGVSAPAAAPARLGLDPADPNR